MSELSVMRRVAIAALMLAAACSSAPRAAPPDLEETTPAAVTELIASGVPVVLNIWASWCIPCRSEAPLLRAAHERFGAEVRFVGIAVRDDPGAAAGFIAEFGLDFEHYLDPRGNVPAAFGGRGVPHTFFFTADGELNHLHLGVIDERTLSLRIDELLRR